MDANKFRSARPPLVGAKTVTAAMPDDPVLRASQRIRSVDAAGTEASGSTVDCDGKSREAARNPSLWQDNVIYSNASLVNTHPEPDPEAPIAGIDSRRSHGLPAIATVAGHHVVLHGEAEETVRHRTCVVQRFTLEDDNPHDKPR